MQCWEAVTFSYKYGTMTLFLEDGCLYRKEFNRRDKISTFNYKNNHLIAKLNYLINNRVVNDLNLTLEAWRHCPELYEYYSVLAAINFPELLTFHNNNTILLETYHDLFSHIKMKGRIFLDCYGLKYLPAT